MYNIHIGIYSVILLQILEHFEANELAVPLLFVARIAVEIEAGWAGAAAAVLEVQAAALLAAYAALWRNRTGGKDGCRCLQG